MAKYIYIETVKLESKTNKEIIYIPNSENNSEQEKVLRAVEIMDIESVVENSFSELLINKDDLEWLSEKSQLIISTFYDKNLFMVVRGKLKFVYRFLDQAKDCTDYLIPNTYEIIKLGVIVDEEDEIEEEEYE